MQTLPKEGKYAAAAKGGKKQVNGDVRH